MISSITAQHRAAASPRLLIEWEPAHRVFFRNLADALLRRSPRIATTSKPAPFWSDVFVHTGVAWRAFLESMVWHMLAVLAAWSLSQGWAIHQIHQPPSTWHTSYVTYYTPSPTFPALGSSRAKVIAHSKRRSGSTAKHTINVAREHAGGIITPPQIRVAGVGQPDIAAANSAAPMTPLSATRRSQLSLPAGTNWVVAPAPTVDQATSRWTGLPQGSVIAPPPRVALGSARAPGAPTQGVIAPPPAVQGSMLRLGDITIGHFEVVAPAPRLPMHEQSTVPGMGQTSLGNPATFVVPPPPVVDRAGTLADGRVGGLSSAGLRGVVPPPPLVQGLGNAAAGGGRGSALSAVSAAVVPPAPSVQGTGNAAAGGRGSGWSTAGSAGVVPPPPSVQGVGHSAVGGRGSALSTVGSAVVPPAPSLQGTGNAAGGGRGNGWSTAGSAGVVPPPPSLQGVGDSDGGGRGSALSAAGSAVGVPGSSLQGIGNSAAGERLLAMDVHPPVSPLPPMPPLVVENSRGPAAEELSLRVVGLALALPASSYFSNYEVYVAERWLGKGESELIKLVYVFLPYQQRLSEYGWNDSRVYKVRVTRDPSCDESLMEMTWPESESYPQAQHSNGASNPNGRNSVLSCYRTTADDYRKAVSRPLKVRLESKPGS